jgi:hypothetical protein
LNLRGLLREIISSESRGGRREERGRRKKRWKGLAGQTRLGDEEILTWKDGERR